MGRALTYLRNRRCQKDSDTCILILALQSQASPLHSQACLLQLRRTLCLNVFFYLGVRWTWQKATGSARDLLPLEAASPLLIMVGYSVATYSRFLNPYLGWIWDGFYTVSHNPPLQAPVAHSGNLLDYHHPSPLIGCLPSKSHSPTHLPVQPGVPSQVSCLCS